MKLTMCLLGAAIALSAGLAAAAQDGAAAGADEFKRNQNTPTDKQGTPHSRSADRAAQRADMKAKNKAGEIPRAGDDWGAAANKQAAREGTHDTRSAERDAKRAEMKQVVKAGEMPVTTEASVASVPGKSR